MMFKNIFIHIDKIVFVAVGVIFLMIAALSIMNAIETTGNQKKIQEQGQLIERLIIEQDYIIQSGRIQLDSLHKAIEQSNQIRKTKIQTIYKNRDEKFNRIDNFNSDSIRSAFSKIY